MDATPILWWPAFFALGTGAVAGLLLVTGMASDPDASAQAVHRARQRRRDDEQELTATLTHLSDLEDRRASVSLAFYEEEKRRLEALAVTLMRRVRAPLANPARPPAATAPDAAVRAGGVVGFFHARPRLRRASWLGVCATAAGFLAFNLSDASRQAAQSEPAAMGAAPMGGAEGVSQEELDGLRQRLSSNGNDADALLRVAHLALRAQQFDDARAFNDRALALVPDSPEGQVHACMLQAAGGEAQAALQRLTELTKRHPGLAEAWFFRGMLGMQSGDMDAMRDAFEQFVRIAPDGAQKDRVRAMLDRSKT